MWDNIQSQFSIVYELLPRIEDYYIELLLFTNLSI